jgi:hypothetical protein
VQSHAFTVADHRRGNIVRPSGSAR